MTDFTPDQIDAIKAAIDKSAGTGYMASGAYLDNVIAELTKPKWTPKVGQVIANKADPDDFIRVERSHSCFGNWKAVTATEIGLEPFEEIGPFGKTTADDFERNGYNKATRAHNAILFPQEDK